MIAFIYLHKQPPDAFVRRCVTFTNSTAFPLEQPGNANNSAIGFLD